jgi:hypothetical protein
MSQVHLSRLNKLAALLTWDCSFFSKGQQLKMLHNGTAMLMKFEVLDGDWLEIAHNACDFGEMAKWKAGDLITVSDLFNAIKEAKVPSTVA